MKHFWTACFLHNIVMPKIVEIHLSFHVCQTYSESDLLTFLRHSVHSLVTVRARQLYKNISVISVSGERR